MALLQFELSSKNFTNFLLGFSLKDLIFIIPDNFSISS